MLPLPRRPGEGRNPRRGIGPLVEVEAMKQSPTAPPASSGSPGHPAHLTGCTHTPLLSLDGSFQGSAVLLLGDKP